MDSFEFLLTFVSIIVAIGITELTFSIHRLLRARQEIQLHWLPILWSAFTFMILIRDWFGFEHLLNEKIVWTSFGFTITILPVFLNLLLALAVLPDKQPSTGFSLIEWFRKEHSYFFSLLFLSYFLTFLSAAIREQPEFPITFQNLLSERWIARLLILSFSVSLLLIKNRLYHKIMAIVFFVMILWMNMGQRLELN